MRKPPEVIAEVSTITLIVVAAIAVQSAASGNTGTNIDPWIDLGKLLVPAILAYLGARLQARKEQRLAQSNIEQKSRDQIYEQHHHLLDSFSAQAKEIMTRSLADAAQAIAERKQAEEEKKQVQAELVNLKMEFARLKTDHDENMRELELLRRRETRRARGKEDTKQ